MGGLLEGRILGWATWGQVGDQRVTYLRPPAAAVFEQVAGNCPNRVEAGPIDDQSALPFGLDQSGAREDCKMCRHRVVRHRHVAGNVARRQAMWLMLDEQPEHIEPRRLGHCGEGKDRLFFFHMSRLVDIWTRSKRHWGHAFPKLRASGPDGWGSTICDAATLCGAETSRLHEHWCSGRPGCLLCSTSDYGKAFASVARKS